MIFSLCDAYVDDGSLDMIYSFDITAGMWIFLGIIVAFAIFVAVILVRAVKRETKENEAKKDSTNGNTPVQGERK